MAPYRMCLIDLLALERAGEGGCVGQRSQVIEPGVEVVVLFLPHLGSLRPGRQVELDRRYADTDLIVVAC